MRHPGFIKRVLGEKRSVPQLIALKETGKFLIHYYWLKSVIKFWNSIVKYYGRNPGMMRHVALADLNMAREHKYCWSKDVSDALATLYSLEDSQDGSLATNLHGGVGPLKLHLTGTK